MGSVGVFVNQQVVNMRLVSCYTKQRVGSSTQEKLRSCIIHWRTECQEPSFFKNRLGQGGKRKGALRPRASRNWRLSSSADEAATCPDTISKYIGALKTLACEIARDSISQRQGGIQVNNAPVIRSVYCRQTETRRFACETLPRSSLCTVGIRRVNDA
jgi:hypothetical protein